MDLGNIKYAESLSMFKELILVLVLFHYNASIESKYLNLGDLLLSMEITLGNGLLEYKLLGHKRWMIIAYHVSQ